MYVSTSSGSAKNKNKIADACPAVAAAVAAANAKPTANKKIDDFKVVNEPKKRFFSRPFQRFSSTPPMSTSVPDPEAAVKTRATSATTLSPPKDHRVVVSSSPVAAEGSPPIASLHNVQQSHANRHYRLKPSPEQFTLVKTI